MKTNRFLLTLPFLALVVVFAGCRTEDTAPSAADIQTAIAQTLTAAPTITNTPTPEAEDTPEPSPTAERITPTPPPGRPVEATVDVAFLNMRSGPSTFFQVVDTLEEGTEVLAQSRLEDNTWVEVEIESDDGVLSGWMFSDYLDFSGAISQLSVAAFPADQTITGLVQDEFQDPIEGVVIAIVLSDDDNDLRVDVSTDVLGRFKTFIPEGLTGILDVQVISPLCSSPLVDDDCQVSAHILLNNREFISIPQGNQEITFVYETAAYTLNGNVLNKTNQPVADINITALRDDGAISYGISDENGDFSLPISEGIWEIYAVVFEPRDEGDPVTVTIADEIPDPVTLIAPE